MGPCKAAVSIGRGRRKGSQGPGVSLLCLLASGKTERSLQDVHRWTLYWSVFLSVEQNTCHLQLKEEHMVLEGSVHGYLRPHQEYHGRRVWQSKVACFMTARKQSTGEEHHRPWFHFLVLMKADWPQSSHLSQAFKIL